jgi:hypothetical protein
MSLAAIAIAVFVIGRREDSQIVHKTSYTLVMITRGDTSVNVSAIPGFTTTKNCEVVGEAIMKTNTNGEIETHCEPVW